MLYAAGLTFYAAIAVVPVMLLGVFLTGRVLGHELVERLMLRLAAYTPESLGLRAGIQSLGTVGPRLGVASLLAALVPATSYGEGLVRAFDRLGGRNQRAKGLRGRLLCLVLLPVLPVVVLAALGAVAVLPDLLGPGRAARLLGVYATFWVGWLTSGTLLALLYRAYTPRALGPAPLFWGAAATGSFMSGMSLGWVLVLRFGVDVGLAFGGSTLLGTLVLSSVYLFLAQTAVLVGYVLTLVLASPGGVCSDSLAMPRESEQARAEVR